MSDVLHGPSTGRNRDDGWLPLESAARYPDIPGSKGASTSVEAAIKIAPHAGRLRQAILKIFKAEPDRRFLPDEIAKLTQERELVIRPRCSELRRLGYLKFTGERRKNPDSGFDAAELTITPAGIEAVK
jgi:hypothetical protein